MIKCILYGTGIKLSRVQVSPELSTENSIKPGRYVSLVVYNRGSRTIKNMYITVEPCQSKKEVIDCNKTENSRVKLKVSYEIGQRQYLEWESDILWYNMNILKIDIVSVEVEFSDGSSQFFNSDDLIFESNGIFEDQPPVFAMTNARLGSKK